MDLTAYAALLRRRWIPLLACLVAALLGAVVATNSSPRKYASSTRLFVNLPEARGVQEALQGVQLSSQLLESYAQIVTSRIAAEKISRQMGGALSPDEVRVRLSATPEPQTLLILISATDTDPRRARDIADAAGTVFVATVNELEAGKVGAVDARIVDPAVLSTSPVSPKPSRNLMLGAILGLVLGFGLALVLEALDRSIKSATQAAEVLGVPLLGVIPQQRDLAAAPQPSGAEPGDRASEAYRAIRTAVRFINLDRPLRTFLVTSASEADGKTTTAVNLAVAFANTGERVALVDADLRRSRVGAMLGLDREPGLSTVLSRQADLSRTIQPWGNRMAVLTSGAPPPNPSEILGSRSMAETITTIGRLGDAIVFDAPPVLPVTDAVVLATQVDAVILVLRAGRTTRAQAAEARRRLEAVGANLVGFVLNGVSSKESEHYYHGYDDTSYQANPSRDRPSIGAPSRLSS